MNLLGIVAAIGAIVTGSSTISGVVVSPGGQPVSGASVFLEPGLAGALTHSQTDQRGAFVFADVPPGLIGIFATADGYGFSGLSQKIPVGDNVSGLSIALYPPGEIAGRVVDAKGDPVSGARVTRFGIMGSPPVGIPLSKLTEFGFEEPVTDKSGSFTVSRLPQGATLTLKVGHPEFAQSGVGDIAAGDRNVRVQLSPGITVRGTVLSRDGSQPVANASIIIGNASPPHDTAIARTDLTGEFAIRLNPGYYLYQAAGMELRSPGWEKLTVSGREPSQRVTLRVAGTTTLAGEVRDAVSGNPISGARLELSAFGSPAESVVTGPSGTYQFTGVEGENQIRLQSVPGYVPPEKPYLTIQDAKQGVSVAIPTFWLRPLPSHRVQVLDDADRPTPGAILRLIRPLQYAVHTTDAEGYAKLDIVSAPEDGTIVGLAEHPTRPLVALFTISNSAADTARVKLFPAGTVTGAVVDQKGKPIEGAVIGGLYQGEGDQEPVQLWRTISGTDGAFRWSGVVPYVPMACLAATGPDGFGRSMAFNASPGNTENVGNVVIADAERARKNQGQSIADRQLDLTEYPVLSGALPTGGSPILILYATVGEAQLYLQALTSVKATLDSLKIDAVLAVDGPATFQGERVPVVQGSAPGAAQTYLINSSGHVVLETWGLPQIAALLRTVDGE
ncbi:MAG: hypothetical protein AMXMBFR82_39140 [Candidatus Hydrogenedentota bacterium]